jgi:hypothetical protein
MKRLLMWIFTGLSLLSFLLLIGTCVLWGRSYGKADVFELTHFRLRPNSSTENTIDRSYFLVTGSGQIQFGSNAYLDSSVGTTNEGVPDHFVGWRLDSYRNGRRPEEKGFYSRQRDVSLSIYHLPSLRPYMQVTSVGCPFWSLCILLVILPSLRTFSYLVQRRSRRRRTTLRTEVYP